MSFERTKVRLDQVCEIRSGKRLPLGHTLVAHRTPFPYIRLVDVKNGSIQNTDLKFLTPETRNCIQRYVVNSGDVCLAIVGHTIGMVFYVQDEWNDANLTENAARITNVKDAVNSKYLYYYLSSQIGQAKILSRKVGSAQGKLPLYNIRSLEVELPPRREQDYVVKLLDALESQIDNLKVTNATLEAIAQALFKSWFVDFDPVRAKLEGRTPEGMIDATAALFPDGFEESELGLVPRGWAVQAVGKLLVPKRGKSITKSKCIEGDIPVVAGGLEPAYFHNQSNVSDPVVTISASGANAGFVRLYQQNIWASDCSFVSVEQTDTVYFWYVFLKSNQEKIYSMQQGAAQPHIYPSDLMRLNICVSKLNEVRNVFNSLVSPFFEQIGLANVQIQTLATLRDTLLPRLISGQLRLPDGSIAM